MSPRGRGARPQPLIAVRDVRAASAWYAQLLAARRLGGAGTEDDHDDLYDRIYAGETLILQLHAWDEEEHPNLVDRERAPPGHGVLLWFEVGDFDAAVTRVAELGAEVIEPPHVNPAPQHREIWLRDPDGYVVVLASPDGEAAGG